MTATLTIFVSDEDTLAPFVKRLIDIEEAWRAAPRDDRPMWPSCDGQHIRRNENGIGLEIRHLPLTVPPLFANLQPTIVVIEEDYLSDVDTGGHLKQGTYRRGRAKALVTRSTHQYKDRDSHVSWQIKVTAPTFDTAVKMYSAIRSGGIQPTLTFDAATDTDTTEQQ